MSWVERAVWVVAYLMFVGAYVYQRRLIRTLQDTANNWEQAYEFKRAEADTWRARAGRSVDR